jgi:hypothetical protein
METPNDSRDYIAGDAEHDQMESHILDELRACPKLAVALSIVLRQDGPLDPAPGIQMMVKDLALFALYALVRKIEGPQERVLGDDE